MKINDLYIIFTLWTMETMIKIYRETETTDAELSFTLEYSGLYDIETAKIFGNETIKWFDIQDCKFLVNTYPEQYRTRKTICIVI